MLGILNRNGAFADLLRLPADNLHVLPKTVDDDAAVFVDGPHHDTATQKERDEAARKKLARAGWLVLRFHHEDNRHAGCGGPPSWQQVLDDNPTVFGTGNKSRR